MALEFCWQYFVTGLAGGFAFTVLVVIGCMLLDRNATRHNSANELNGEDIRKVK